MPAFDGSSRQSVMFDSQDRSFLSQSYIYIAYLFIVVPNIGDMANINSQSKPICKICYSF